ncbi:hypothetical protein GS501_06860 [Saccharibacter sp. 17.LH.SD]|uniref:hypothetical protein n=1 Tax=Saccharibacter sp. 17.LH.SD TaxID=2689393 RepID=UPI00136F425F|nr:hypothetical protein [Saccharibacter sp. 17.LH.SD]MXV44755.1 hypothetical protein [Saccharibacter sp. 17.LH.SD]
MLRKYLIRSVAIGTLVSSLLLLVSLWIYYRSTLLLAHQLVSFQQSSAAYGVELSFSTTQRKGWPWGAELYSVMPKLLYHHDNIQIGGVSSSVKLGGTWWTWLWYGLHNTMPPIHFPNPLIIRILQDDHIITLHLNDLTLSPSAITTKNAFFSLTFHSSDIALSYNGSPYPLHLAPIEGTLFVNPSANPHESRIGLQLTIGLATLQKASFPLNLPLHNVHMALSLAGANTPLSVSLKQGIPLHIHDISIDIPFTAQPNGNLPRFPPTHISLSGTLNLPNGNGLLFLQFTHWRLGLYSALDLPIFQQRLAPNILASLKRYLVPSPNDDTLEEHPITLSVPLAQWHLSGLPPEKVRALYQMLLHSPK